ncbi:oligopeptide ABC transporter solute-binding protein [Natronococcus amylolyticus DSM 10524]|uniref:Oligopeptide ABC transporter solute-binding protein n=1 Tax=Natronococcus amylolyticus DSM 10524 TaxID=1227497 RepID=L9XEW7_9EURY|nr:ABC transporter substrate-binding protein [Natronococcus amylolyticus]ELY60274.1 oligopeptide ABC transporter solute-binding protein [Natronococcus amylolyticus DSM 10524]
MVQDHKQSSIDIDRRRLLQGAGGVSIAAVAGCLGGDDGDDDAPIHVQLEVNSDNDDRVQMVDLIATSLEESGYFTTEIDTYEFNDYSQRVMDPEYAENGYVPCIGLSGTFNPESFCQALHHSDNIGQCCNLNGISDDELDQMMDDARYGVDVADDDEERRERYDEIWEYLADERYSSITHFDLQAGVMNTNVHGFRQNPFTESTFSYGLHAPQDEVVTWIDEDAHPDETDISDLEEGGTLRAGLTEDPELFDPPYTTGAPSTLVQVLIFEQLVASDTEGNLYPWLAEDYELVETQDIDRTDYEEYMIEVDADEEGVLDTDEQVVVTHPDDNPAEDDTVRVLTPEEAGEAVEDGVFGMQFQYELHEGIEFTNGEELTAEHVVATARRYENSDLEAQTYDSLLYAEEVDEYTVNLYAQIPDAEAERELPGLYIHSLEQAELEGGELDPSADNDPIGTGPYELSDYSEGQYVEFTKNDGYWLEEIGLENKEWFDGPEEFPDGPVIDELEMEIVPDDSSRAGALQSDEIDMTYGLATDVLDDFEEDDDYVIDSVEAGGYEYIQYPMNVEPWDDDRLRRAVNHLVPRQEIVDNVLNGWARPAWTDLPELAEENGTTDAEALEETIRPTNEYDPEAAAELIEEVIEDHDLE